MLLQYLERGTAEIGDRESGLRACPHLTVSTKKDKRYCLGRHVEVSCTRRSGDRRHCRVAADEPSRGFQPTVTRGDDGRVASATPEDVQPSLTRRASFLTRYPALKRRARI
ncbi:MAG: hypothetical protein ACHQX3_12370, partial [Nitrospirales bacterium]